jgi:hypothetical protein
MSNARAHDEKKTANLMLSFLHPSLSSVRIAVCGMSSIHDKDQKSSVDPFLFFVFCMGTFFVAMWWLQPRRLLHTNCYSPVSDTALLLMVHRRRYGRHRGFGNDTRTLSWYEQHGFRKTL